MSDPLGPIGALNSVQQLAPLPGRAGPADPTGADFKQFLREQIARVNELQSDATMAVEDLAAGRRDDLESVLAATQKADIAFQTLLQLRNKLMEAYTEITQIRV